MSIQKKSLISNRVAVKKANVTKASATKVSSTKLNPVRIMGTLIKSKVIVH